jgi:hypothetical protein
MSFYEEIAKSSEHKPPRGPYAIHIQDYMANDLTIGRAERLSDTPESNIDRILHMNMIARENAGYNKAIDDALAVFAEFELHFRLNIDLRNDFCDRVSGLKKKQ